MPARVRDKALDPCCVTASANFTGLHTRLPPHGFEAVGEGGDERTSGREGYSYQRPNGRGTYVL